MYKLLKLFDYSPVQRTLSVVYMLVTRHFLVPTRYTGTVGQRAIKQAYHSQQYILLPRLKSLYALFCCVLLSVNLVLHMQLCSCLTPHLLLVAFHTKAPKDFFFLQIANEVTKMAAVTKRFLPS